MYVAVATIAVNQEIINHMFITILFRIFRVLISITFLKESNTDFVDDSKNNSMNNIYMACFS